MAQMRTNIERVVSDISSRTTMFDVLFEALTNAIYANADQISCFFESDTVLEAEEGKIAPRKVVSITVEDNGDGFNDGNYHRSFCVYKTDFNKSHGCKGVGRFAFLKVFHDVNYESHLKDTQEIRTFSFGLDFDEDRLQKKAAYVEENKTVLCLSGVTLDYYNPAKNSDRRIDCDLQMIKKEILIKLIPTLFLYKQKGVCIRINLTDKKEGHRLSITEKEVPDFEVLDFNIHGEDSSEYSFHLYHSIVHDSGDLCAFYCADDRTVSTFSDHDLNVSLPRGYSGYFLLKSGYLDDRADDIRNQFNIFPVKTDFWTPLSWEMINKEIKRVISGLIRDEVPQAIELNRSRLDEIATERPYLVEYIDEEDVNIAGFIDKPQIIKKAKKRFDESKEALLAHAGKAQYTDKELQDAIDVARSELISYIQDRVKVIERLKTMLKDKEKVEKIIHNLFMERYTEEEYSSERKNNLWLLDDRFTSYCYAASDKRIKDILQKFGYQDKSTYSLNKPDLALFFSHDPSNKRDLKAVVIELKSFKDGKQDDREKFAGIQELLDHIEAFETVDEVQEIWAYLVTDIDDNLEHRLRRNGYHRLFSTNRGVFFHYFEEINAFVYVLNIATLIDDAEARNKVFIEIINRQNRLSRIFKKVELEAK